MKDEEQEKTKHAKHASVQQRGAPRILRRIRSAISCSGSEDTQRDAARVQSTSRYDKKDTTPRFPRSK